MNKGLISVRYATALLQFAKDENVAEEVYEQSKFLTSVFSQLKNLPATISNPIL